MGAERRLTRQLAKLFGGNAAGVVIGPGDDAAIVVCDTRMVLTCDPVVEGVHFDSDASPFLVGQKAVNRNLSDLAAMGARPQFLLVSALLPPELSTRRRGRLFAGILKAATAAGCKVVGGDVCRSPGPLVLTVTATGRAPKRPLLRTGLRPGQELHVTGVLGGAGLGQHLRFQPRLGEGQWLAQQKGITAAMDISDGLLLDLETMLIASGGLGAELYEEAIPISRAARRLASQSGRSPLEHALGDGEDHELLFARSPGTRLPGGGPLSELARRPIGQVCKQPGLFLIDGAGQRHPLKVQGYEHEVQGGEGDPHGLPFT